MKKRIAELSEEEVKELFCGHKLCRKCPISKETVVRGHIAYICIWRLAQEEVEV